MSYQSNTKYKNKKTKIDGFMFDSRKEARRYLELKLLLRAGKITDLSLQPEFKIVESVRDPKTNRKLLARKYIADFKYKEVDKWVVEDVKSAITAKEATYRLKRQLFLVLYPEFLFREV